MYLEFSQVYFKGLLPQCAIVGPEKAVKLSVNDFIRIRYADETGKTPLKGQFIASITAGIMQVKYRNANAVGWSL